jgi:hypothetical protein
MPDSVDARAPSHRRPFQFGKRASVIERVARWTAYAGLALFGVGAEAGMLFGPRGRCYGGNPRQRQSCQFEGVVALRLSAKPDPTSPIVATQRLLRSRFRLPL